MSSPPPLPPDNQDLDENAENQETEEFEALENETKDAGPLEAETTQDTETEPQDAEPQDAEPQDAEPQDAETQDAETQDAETQDAETQDADAETQDAETQDAETQDRDTAETVEQLAKKLQEHKDQLAQVEELLRENPHDETLLKLKNDLSQVVALTEDLTQMPLSKLGAGKEDSLAGVPELPADVPTRSGPPALPALPDGPFSMGDKKWAAGDRCQALWEDGKWYNARIDGVTTSDNFSVTYLDFGNTADVPESSLRLYVHATENFLSQGVRVKALWKEDGLFYDAVVEKAVEPGIYALKFAKYKKKRRYDVPIYDIVLRDATQKVEQFPEKLEIPDHLKYKPSDSESQKVKKRKQIKRLKSNFRQKKREEEGTLKQKSWQSFIQGHKKKQKMKPKESIFASPTEVDGRVGVVGSGKPLTEYVQPHKHLFSNSRGDPSEVEMQPPETPRYE